jgi:hypothetical protein
MPTSLDDFNFVYFRQFHQPDNGYRTDGRGGRANQPENRSILHTGTPDFFRELLFAGNIIFFAAMGMSNNSFKI